MELAPISPVETEATGDRPGKKRELWLDKWRQRRRFFAQELHPEPQESKPRRMGRAILRMFGVAPSAEHSRPAETKPLVEQAKKVGRWAVFLVTGARAEVWRATADESLKQRVAEVRPLVVAEHNLNEALRDLKSISSGDAIKIEEQKTEPPSELAKESEQLARVYQFPAPRHPERQTDPNANAEFSPEDSPTAFESTETDNFYDQPSDNQSVAYEATGISRSTLAAAEAMRRISTPEVPPLRTGLLTVAAAAVAVGLGASRHHWKREARVLSRENQQLSARLTTQEQTLRHLQAKRPHLREAIARQAYVGEVAAFANKEARQIHAVAAEARQAAVETPPPRHSAKETFQPERRPTISVPDRIETPQFTPLIERNHSNDSRLDSVSSGERLTRQTPEVAAEVATISKEVTSYQEVTERELANRIERPTLSGAHKAAGDGGLSQTTALKAGKATAQARQSVKSEQPEQQAWRQHHQLSMIAYGILVAVALLVVVAAMVWL